MYCREIYRNILTPIAEKRIKDKQCPSCGLPKSKWNRRTDWTCCSVDCTKNFWAEHDKSISWQGQRLKALKRDNYTCQKCGLKMSKKTGAFHVHHKIPFLTSFNNSFDNLVTLCPSCHRKEDAIKEMKNKGGKKIGI